MSLKLLQMFCKAVRQSKHKSRHISSAQPTMQNKATKVADSTLQCLHQCLNCGGDGGDASPHRDLSGTSAGIVMQTNKKFFFGNHLFLSFGEDVEFRWRLVFFFFLEINCLFSARKSLWVSAKTFFVWSSPNFHWKIASIQFKTDENLGQVLLRLDQTSKPPPPPPPLRNLGYAPDLHYGPVKAAKAFPNAKFCTLSTGLHNLFFSNNLLLQPQS